MAHTHHPHPDPPAATDPPKRSRLRTLRACDACRKMKIKCLLAADEAPCEACTLASRACKFEHVGVKREKPPSALEVEQLQCKIAQLEAVLSRLRPNIDPSSFPRTTDQAKTMASALQATSNDPRPAAGKIHTSPSKETDDHTEEHEEFEKDSQDDDEDDDDEDDDFQSMLNSMDDCQLSSYQLLDQAKDHPSSPHDHAHAHSREASVPTGPAAPEDLSASFIQNFWENFPQKNADQAWPAPDLAAKLICAYFESVHPYPRVIHEHEFRNDYQAGLAARDTSFRGLCYSLFAAASPHIDDPRVLHPTQAGDSPPRQSAGALFAHASLHATPKHPPLSLLKLQSFAVLSYYMLAMSNPRHTSALVVDFLRIAVASGAHLEDSPRWDSSFLKNQLRKRAFFSLIAVEKHTTTSLGYLSVPQPLSNLVSPPICADDATISLLDKQDSAQPTVDARKQFREQLHMRAQTPAEAACNSIWSFRKKLESRSRNLVLNHLKAQPSIPAQTLSSSATDDDHPSSSTNQSRLQFIVNFGTAIADFIENEMNPLGRWDPSLTSKEDLFATSHSSCMLWSIQIRVHLEAIAVYQDLVNPCFHAASSVLDTLQDLKVLGHLHILQGAIPYFLVPVGLFLLWAVSQDDNRSVTADFKANAWLKIMKCVEILNILAPASFVSEKLSTKFTLYMEDLKEEIHNPAVDAATTTSKKRPLSEIIAKMVEQPTISNLLFSQHPSPINQNSQVAPGPDIGLTLPDFMKTRTSQLPAWNYDANTPAMAVPGPLNPSHQHNADDPLSYSHLQLQNLLLLQSAHVPPQPSDATYAHGPLPPSRAPQPLADPTNAALWGGGEVPYLPPTSATSSAHAMSLPRTLPHVVPHERQGYAGIDGGLNAPMGSHVMTAQDFGNHNSFDPSSFSFGATSHANLPNDFSFSSTFAPLDFTPPDHISSNLRHRLPPPPNYHPIAGLVNLTQAVVPNQPYGQPSSCPQDKMTTYSTFLPNLNYNTTRSSVCTDNQVTVPNQYAGLPHTQHPPPFHPSAGLSTSSTAYTPPSATSASFSDGAMHQAQTRVFAPPATPSSSKDNLAPLAFGLDGGDETAIASQTDINQLFSSICDTWLF